MVLTIARTSATGCCPHTTGPCGTSNSAVPLLWGGQLYYCPQCDQQRFSYHSCKNRHCPKCQNEQANAWLTEQQSLLLPVTHFLLTFTLPAELRALAPRNQKTIYNLLFRASAAALLQLA